MTHLRHTALTIALATAALGAWAQTEAELKKHQESVPAAGQFSAQPSASTVTPATAEKMGEHHQMMEKRMEMMTAMRQMMMDRMPAPDAR